MKKQAFIFIGRSGCGKGTQADLLAETLRKADPSRGVCHVETGGEMRRFIQGNLPAQKMAKGITDSGGLQPEFVAIHQWTNFLVNQYNATDHLIFDGSPRKVNEAVILDSVFPFYGIEKPWIIYLDVDPGEIHSRLLKRGRIDDTREGISRRLAWFETEVSPTLQHYRNSSGCRFLDVNGVGPIHAIHADIVKKIGLVDLTA